VLWDIDVFECMIRSQDYIIIHRPCVAIAIAAAVRRIFFFVFRFFFSNEFRSSRHYLFSETIYNNILSWFIVNIYAGRDARNPLDVTTHTCHKLT